jgi:hypothetical protein
MKVEGFRSLRAPQKIALKDGQSMCLLADNGRGKSSVVDALEFWSTGDVAWVHRDGIGLSALVHLYADEAIVEVATDSVAASRRLAGTRAGELQVGQGVMLAGSTPGPIPMLRHRTMSDFVYKTANDKRTELLTMLGLTELVPFRLGLRSAARRVRGDAHAAAQAAQTAASALEQALGGSALGARIVELVGRAGVSVATEEELLTFAPDRVEGAAPAATRLAQVDELDAANRAVAESSVKGWNAALADKQIAGERGLSGLLAAGEQLLAGWDEDRCPLCLVEQSRDELVERIRARALELAEADRRFLVVATEAEDREQAALRLGRALRAVVNDERNANWEHLGTAREALEALRAEIRAVKDARGSRAALNVSAPTLPEEALVALRSNVARAPGESGPALLELAQLRGRLAASRQAAAEQRGAERVAAAAERAAEMGDAAVRDAIDAALEGLNTTVSAYYAKLVGDSPYGDVRLEYQDSRTGGVEFRFVWDEQEEVSPPQRIMSESQLGALGLALFLARLKVRPPQWRTVVLDDVVTSFDVVHRVRLVRLLAQEFADWQVILCTHDHLLSRVITDETKGWRQVKVTSWTAAAGPVFGEAEPRRRLRQLLQHGQSADELGGLARQAMEQALERPVRRLGLRIRHDPTNMYSADEYRRALLDGLRVGCYVHADHPILRRLSTDGSVTNRACHFKDHAPGVTAADLELIVEDLDELDGLFVCGTCDKPAWEVRDSRTAHCQCPCGALSCA